MCELIWNDASVSPDCDRPKMYWAFVEGLGLRGVELLWYIPERKTYNKTHEGFWDISSDWCGPLGGVEGDVIAWAELATPAAPNY